MVQMTFYDLLLTFPKQVMNVSQHDFCHPTMENSDITINILQGIASIRRVSQFLDLEELEKDGPTQDTSLDGEYIMLMSTPITMNLWI